VVRISKEEEMKKLPIGIQTFFELVDPEENYVYMEKPPCFTPLPWKGNIFSEPPAPFRQKCHAEHPV